MELTLNEIAAVFSAPVPQGLGSTKVDSITIDSRAAGKGSLFFAIKGGRVDGHDFIMQAKKMGSMGAVVESRTDEIANDDSFLLFRVESTLEALQELAGFYRDKFNTSVIGVAGSNGKTTTKEMIAAVLEKKYRTVKSKDNLNNHIGVPLTILSWREQTDYAVLEMGANHNGEISNLCTIAKPNHGVITNIGKGHIGYFGSIENILKAKMELVESLPNIGIAFLNGDDAKIREYTINTVKTITYGFNENCNIRGINPHIDHSGRVVMDVDNIEIPINLPGIHNLYNGLAAAAVGLEFGISRNDIRDSLANFYSVEKRTEIVFTTPFTLINDSYNANPDSMEAAFKSAKEMVKKGRLIAILGDMFELGRYSKNEHKALAERLKFYGFDALFCTGKYMTYSAEAARDKGISHVHHYKSVNNLISDVKEFISSGDIVLVKGSRGMHMERVADELENLNFDKQGE